MACNGTGNLLEVIEGDRQLATGHLRGQAACLRAFKGTGNLLEGIYVDRQLAYWHLRGRQLVRGHLRGLAAL